MSSSYNRNTELRNVHTKDLYNLAVILDDDNYWQTLMEIIPKELNNQTFGNTAQDLEKIASGSAYERKYNNDHIRLIENAIRRPGESRLYSQILFDEWGSSGRKHERPTLGVLLHLLVQSKLYRAADFVAELLNEPKPQRPSNGPAAEFEFEIDVFNDIQETVNDTRFYPNTEDLEENVNIDINKDYYTKYHKIVDKKIPTINDNTEEPIMTVAPKPPPRLLKSARLLKQQQLQQQQQQQLSNQLLQQTANKNDINNKSPNNIQEQVQQQIQQLNTHSNNESVSVLSSASTNNMPKLSALMNSTNSIITTTTTTMTTTNYSSEVSETVLPKLSALNNSSERISQHYGEEDEDDSLNSTPSLIYTKPNIVQDHDHEHSDMNSIPIVVLSKPLNIDTKKEQAHSENDVEINDDLPAISALNLNGERDEVIIQQNQLQQSNNFENVPSVALNYTGHRRASFEECAVHDEDLNIPCLVANMNFNENPSRHQLESIEEDYNGIEHEHDNEGVVGELDEDEDSIPNLSFLENRSSNNESSLTSVTNTSGDNSFEQSVNDCSSTSTDNVPFLSVFNQ
ncbi:protein Tube [Lucilia sericata]|uniref:protein Tube n=1 Tax=Lucilia sericata TaxID=13632 RepID=UPI0018A80975|nr:protein Tube [Lucilia sericata]